MLQSFDSLNSRCGYGLAILSCWERQHQSAVYFVPKRAPLLCSAASFAASRQHPARLDLLLQRRCQPASRGHAPAALSLPLLLSALSPACKMCYSRSAIHHSNMTATNCITANPSTTESLRALVYNSAAHRDRITCLCSDCRSRSCIIQIYFVPTFAPLQFNYHYSLKLHSCLSSSHKNNTVYIFVQVK